MIGLKIDNEEVRVPKGLTVLAAARMQGADVPSMCYREGKEHFTSCMICMVKDGKSGKLFPSCSVKAEEGMEIITKDEEIIESRRVALELLLSEHVGDCEAPCVVTCPAHMDIPLMNRLLKEGKTLEALRVVKQDIAMPAVFGRVCPAPCEGACRRKSIDSAVSICLLKRFAGDDDLDGTKLGIEIAADNGKRVCVIGAGPAGLAAAYYLRLQGFGVELIDKNEFAGGRFWKEVEAGVLPKEVLTKELGQITGTGVIFRNNTKIDKVEFDKLRAANDAVVIATGSRESVAEWGLAMHAKGLEAEKETFETSIEGVYAVGSVLRPAKLAIRCAGQGKDVAKVVGSLRSSTEGSLRSGSGPDGRTESSLRSGSEGSLRSRTGPDGRTESAERAREQRAGEQGSVRFNSRFGKLLPEELEEYLKESVVGDREEPKVKFAGLIPEQVKKEAARCLHCDCRSKDDCLLRELADEYGANQKRYWSEDRKLVSKQIQHEFVVFEASKCIKCGRCVHITAEHKEKYGMSFIGRGFDVVVGVPFGEGMDEGLRVVAEEVVRECPTGALGSRG